MKNKIDRTLLLFKDGENRIKSLSDRYFGISILLNRLLNKNYDGKVIRFMNINFNSKKSFELYPIPEMSTVHFSGSHFNCYYLFDFNKFYKAVKTEQDQMVWKKAYEVLQDSAIKIKNNELKTASDYAYKKGLEMNLNPDYKILEKDFIINDKEVNAAVWVNFKDDGMYSKFTLEKSGIIIYELPIDATQLGVEFFLEVYKRLEYKGNNIIIKGHNELPYLPFKIPLDEKILNLI